MFAGCEASLGVVQNPILSLLGKHCCIIFRTPVWALLAGAVVHRNPCLKKKKLSKLGPTQENEEEIEASKKTNCPNAEIKAIGTIARNQ